MQRKLQVSRAFTLVEMMVVVTIFGFVAIGILPFFVMNLRSQFVGEQKLLINGDIRKMTNQMVENAREANTFVLYQSFCSQTRWDGVTETRDTDGSGTVDFSDRLATNNSGDFMVLVFYTDPYYDPALYDGVLPATPPTITKGTVTRLIGYWVAPNRKYPGENALYVFDTDTYHTNAAATTWASSWGVTFPATLSGGVTLESLLPPATTAYSQAAEFPILVNNLNGLSSQCSFYNYLDRSVIIKTKILHGNLAKRVTNTYNFTITPRG